MPTYDFQCEAGHRYEKRLPFGSAAEQPCERCGKPARRMPAAAPVVFKGSGWYKTDSRGSSSSRSSSSSSSSGSTATKSEGRPDLTSKGSKRAASANGKSSESSD